MRLIIAGNGDVEHAGRLATWLNRPAVDQVVVSVPWLEVAERHRLARTLEMHFNDGGYAFGVPAFVAALAWCFYTGSWSSDAASLPAAAAYTVAVSVASAMGGKLAGLAWSRWRLRTLLRHIAAAEPSSPGGAIVRRRSGVGGGPLGGGPRW
jgi:hypothetical protein